MMKGLPRSLKRSTRGYSPVDRTELKSLARIAASSITALTDNSGGSAADGTVAAIGNVTPAVLGSNDAAQLASSVTANLTAVDAYKELIAQMNAFQAVVPALPSVITDSLTGTAADKTIGAITVNGIGVGTSMVGAPALVAWFTAMSNTAAQLAAYANRFCVACGVAPLVDNSGGLAPLGMTVANVTVISGTATGADAGANAIVKVTDYNAKMQLLADFVKEVAAKLNACRSATGGALTTVATF